MLVGFLLVFILFVQRTYRLSFLLLSGTVSGVISFGTGGGRTQNKITPTMVPFSVSVFAVVANKIETATCF